MAGAAFSYLTTCLFRAMARPQLVIAPDRDQSRKICAELGFFFGGSGGLEGNVVLFPAVDWYTPESTESSQKRASALARIHAVPDKGPITVVAPAEAIYQRTLSPDSLAEHFMELKAEKECDRDKLIKLLMEGSYSPTSQVTDPGEFSIRGGILDLFPAGSPEPFRLEFFGDTIESLRSFDPVTQRSSAAAKAITVSPFHEVILGGRQVAEVEKRIMDLARDLKQGHLGPPEKASSQTALREITEQINRGEHFRGIEQFIPYFDPRPSSLLDHLSPDWLLVVLDPFSADESLSRRAVDWSRAWEELIQEGGLVPPPENLMAPPKKVSKKLKSFCSLVVGEQVLSGKDAETFPPTRFTMHFPRWKIEDSLNLSTMANLDIRARPGAPEPLSRVLEKIQEWRKSRVTTVLVSASAEKGRVLQSMLEEHELFFPLHLDKDLLFEPDGRSAILVGELDRGFFFPAAGLALISEAEIFGERIRPHLQKKFKESFFSDLGDLNEGDLIVHVDHGLGIYRGMTELKVQEIGHWDFINLRERPRMSSHCLALEYANGDLLYLPVHRLNLLQKYRGAEGARPGLDRLGSNSWERSKRKVRKSLEEMAEELVKIYAARRVYEGYAFPPRDSTFSEFEAGFPYEETPDQLQAIEEVLSDMEKNKPMDRLVCGDVGYGKTEVALRAAFKAAMDGKQVAVLVPTTILAAQHFHTFSERLRPYPVEVRMFSRFQTQAAQKKIIQGLYSGVVDIVIGTHRLLSQDVQFRDLGMVVIDEEQRFGVRHKEKLKKLRATVDVLTLTATPIPRTLHLSLLGLRDLSIIDTPPPDRQAVHTEVARLNDHLIREAVMRELARSGQVFFVHNRVQGIESVAGYLRRLLPDVRIAVAHGQMPERKLEKVMEKFVTKEYDLLVSTAIIESGLDIPSVNTMIIHRADQFGLAQLYQLRGRIGRSKEKGYAYLLVPGRGLLSAEATKRLKALKEFTELGSGFKVAAYDLEIRGAGNILGREQSGHINRIGFELYARLLEDAVKRLRGEDVEPEIEPEINLQVPAYIPESYIPDQGQRLVFYRRLSKLREPKELSDLAEEMRDRFGSRPKEVRNLFEVVAVKARLIKLRALGIEYTGRDIVLDLGKDAKVAPDRVIHLVTSHPDQYRLSPEHKLFISHPFQDHQALFEQINNLLEKILV